MDFIGEKLTSYSASALSGVNELKRKRKQKSQQQQQTNEGGENQASDLEEEEEYQTQSRAPKPSANIATNQASQSNIYNRTLNESSAPFGGDSFSSSTQQAPPAIGFRAELFNSLNNTSEAQNSKLTQHDKEPSSSSQPPVITTGFSNNRRHNVSETSLYEGDAWTRLWFQRVMILTLIRLFLFIGKIYEDFQATKLYRLNGNRANYLLSLVTLFMPTLVFTLYRVARYLQIALPKARNATNQHAISASSSSQEPAQQVATPAVASSSHQSEAVELSASVSKVTGDEDKQAKKSSSLMRDNTQQVEAAQQEEEGLVTARQTPNPVLLEEYHDSKSQQDQQLTTTPSSPAPSTAIMKTALEENDGYKERVDVEKLGQLPDRETVRVTIGASEQLLHGVLFVFWQLKRQVDVVGYLVERACLWRKPKEQEKEELERLRTGSDGLEWFQDFYAAFLAILAQVYTLALNWSNFNNKLQATNANTLNAAAPSLTNLVSKEPGELSISNTAKALSNTLPQQLITDNSLSGKDLLIMSQLLVSTGVVFSLLIAVRRKDDGPLTLGLSMLGWGSIFASRIIIISMSFVHIGPYCVLPLIVCHILGIAIWIYKIAIDSHNGKKSETEEFKWDPTMVENAEQEAVELRSDDQPNSKSDHSQTQQWPIIEHVVLVTQVTTLFAIPSLFYWPIMFNLKLHCRPFKYLVLILTENFVLVLGILYYIANNATQGQWYLLGAAGALSILGFMFVSLYVSCKPSLTEYFARADELFNEAEKSGIYFEFCSRVFKMPDLGKQAFLRLMNQSERLEEDIVYRNDHNIST